MGFGGSPARGKMTVDSEEVLLFSGEEVLLSSGWTAWPLYGSGEPRHEGRSSDKDGDKKRREGRKAEALSFGAHYRQWRCPGEAPLSSEDEVTRSLLDEAEEVALW